MIAIKKFVSLAMVAIETGKSQPLLRRKMLHQNHESYKYVVPQKIWVDWITTRREKMSQPQKWTFWEKASEK